MSKLAIRNEKVIMIETDKTFAKGTKNMLKTLDNKFISRKVIKNPKHKLYWRHIYSFLPAEILDVIIPEIYRYIYSQKIIRNYCSLIDKNDMNIYNFHTNNRLKYDKHIEDKLIQKDNKKHDNIRREWFYNNRFCLALTNKGEICGCRITENNMYQGISLDRDYYNKLINPINFTENALPMYWGDNSNRDHNRVDFHTCKKHKNFCLSKENIDACYKKLGYELKHGYMCKVCEN